MALFSKNVNDVRNPIAVRAAVEETADAEFLGKVGNQVLEANAGIRAGKLRAEIESDIDAYANQYNKFEKDADTLATNYADQTAALAEQTKEFQDDPEFADPGVIETEAQFRERAFDLRQAYDQGAMSYDDLRLKLETSMRGYIASLPGEAARFRRTASEVLGDNEQRIKPYREAEAAQAKLAQAAVVAEQKEMIEAAQLNMTVPEYRKLRQWEAQRKFKTETEADNWQSYTNNQLANIQVGATQLIGQHWLQGGGVGWDDRTLNEQVVPSLNQYYDRMEAQIRQQAMNSRVNPSDAIKQLRADKKYTIDALRADSKGAITEKIYKAQQTIIKAGWMESYGALHTMLMTEPKAFENYQKTIEARQEIFDMIEQGADPSVIEAKKKRWTLKYGLYARELWPNDTWTSSAPTRGQPLSTSDAKKIAEESRTDFTTQQDKFTDPTSAPKEQQNAYTAISEIVRLDDTDAIEAVAKNKKLFAKMSESQYNTQWKNLTTQQFAIAVDKAAAIMQTPVLRGVRGPKGNTLSEDAILNLRAWTANLQAFGPQWDIPDVSMYIVEKLTAAGITPRNQKEIMGELDVEYPGPLTSTGEGGPAPRMSGEGVRTGVAPEVEPYTPSQAQIDQDDIRRVMQQANAGVTYGSTPSAAVPPSRAQRAQNDIRAAVRGANAPVSAGVTSQAITGNDEERESMGIQLGDPLAGLAKPEAEVPEVDLPEASFGEDPSEDIIDLLHKREGFVPAVYEDSLGKKTLGYGHLVRGNRKYKLVDGTTKKGSELEVGDEIAPEQIEELFRKNVKTAYEAAKSQAEEAGIDDPEFLKVLTSVNYQLGTGWTKVFKTSWPAIKRGDFDTAIEGISNSKWAQQTPVRVRDFIEVLESLK